MSAKKTILFSILLALAGWGLLNLDYWWQDVVGPVKDGPTRVQAAVSVSTKPATPMVVPNKTELNLIVVGIKNNDLQKIPIGLNASSDLDDDGDGLSNKLEKIIGTDYLKNDTDGDGISDGAEIKAWQNPLGAGKLPYSLTLINRLKGKLLLQVDGHGELWYLSALNGKRYYMSSKEEAKNFVLAPSNETVGQKIIMEPNTLWIESLNLQAPVVYVTEATDKVFQPALENGVVHYPGTANPGEFGNDYIFGHSSDYRWRSGSYKRIFATLPNIGIGAIIYISDNKGSIFKYKVFESKVVPTTAVEYLGQYDYKRQLLTLQTSYPINTALKRWVVVAELVTN